MRIINLTKFLLGVVLALGLSIDDVKVLNISEGLFGEDVMTFEYEGQKRESSIYRRP